MKKSKGKLNDGYLAGVFFCCSTNSTMFTECCEVAICDDEKKCPKCGNNVLGYDAETNHKRHMIRWRHAFKK